jgi:hypothetical protein
MTRRPTGASARGGATLQAESSAASRIGSPNRERLERHRRNIGPYYATAAVPRRRPTSLSPVLDVLLLGPSSCHAGAGLSCSPRVSCAACAIALDDRPTPGRVAGFHCRRANGELHALSQCGPMGHRPRARPLLHAQGGAVGGWTVVGYRPGHRLGIGAGLRLRVLAGSNECRAYGACQRLLDEGHDLLCRCDRRRIRDDAVGGALRRKNRSRRRRPQFATGDRDGDDPLRDAMGWTARPGDSCARREK